MGSLACFFSNSCCLQGSPRALSRSAAPSDWCVAKKCNFLTFHNMAIVDSAEKLRVVSMQCHDLAVHFVHTRGPQKRAGQYFALGMNFACGASCVCKQLKEK